MGAEQSCLFPDEILLMLFERMTQQDRLQLKRAYPVLADVIKDQSLKVRLTEAEVDMTLTDMEEIVNPLGKKLEVTLDYTDCLLRKTRLTNNIINCMSCLEEIILKKCTIPIAICTCDEGIGCVMEELFARVPKVVLDECDKMTSASHNHMDPKWVWFYWSQNLAKHVFNSKSQSPLQELTFLNTLPVLDSWQLMEYTGLVREGLLDFESGLLVEIEDKQGEVMNMTSVMHPNGKYLLRSCVNVFYQVMGWSLPLLNGLLSPLTFLGLPTPPKTVKQIKVWIEQAKIKSVRIKEDFDMGRFRNELFCLSSNLKCF